MKRFQGFDVSLFAGAVGFRSFGTWRSTPKSRLGDDEFDRDLGLAHQGRAQADDSTEQFLSKARVLKPDHLLRLDCGREKYQSPVVAHNHGVGFFRDGLLVGIPESRDDGSLVLDAFAAPTIPSGYFIGGCKGHKNNVTNFPESSQGRVSLKIRKPSRISIPGRAHEINREPRTY